MTKEQIVKGHILIRQLQDASLIKSSQQAKHKALLDASDFIGMLMEEKEPAPPVPPVINPTFSGKPQFNFNTSPELWSSYRRGNPTKNIRVQDGHVIVGTEVLARFTNDTEARICLLKSGYMEVVSSPGTFKP
jgi:hypothetical protein